MELFNNNNIIYEDALYDYHGTYVASTILKVFPCAKILPVKFLNSTYGTIEDSISAVKYAISRGAKIINCSWNFNDDSKELFELIKIILKYFCLRSRKFKSQFR